jgi:hypothetical protein
MNVPITGAPNRQYQVSCMNQLMEVGWQGVVAGKGEGNLMRLGIYTVRFSTQIFQLSEPNVKWNHQQKISSHIPILVNHVEDQPVCVSCT